MAVSQVFDMNIASTKLDYSVDDKGFLFVLLLVLFVFGIITIFYHGKIVRLVYASLGALVFSFYLVFDTQLMMGKTKI